MRNPSRKVLYCLLALIVGAGLIRFGFGREQRIGEHWSSIVPIFLGFGIVPFALVTFIQALFAARGQARLLRGEGVIARWQVFPTEWEQFRRLDSSRSAKAFALGNDLWVRRAAPMEPVEVIIGEKSAMIDGSWHPLTPRGLPELRGVSWLEGPPICLEFALLYPPGRYGSSVPKTLRIPVPPSARAAAERVVAHFEPITRRHPPLALRDPPRTYRVCAILVLGSALAAILGYALARADPDGSGSLVQVGLMVAGTIFGTFALILALATFLLTRRR